MLKVDLHLHTSDDPHDEVGHSARELIDRAVELKFDVIAITNHDQSFEDEKMRSYAKNRNILLIPGVEATIEGKHVLLLNFPDTNGSIKKLADIKKFKNGETLVIAPHPFYPNIRCLRSKLVNDNGIFDAIEFSHYHFKGCNFNRKAVLVSKKKGLPLIGTSDTHRLWQMNKTYTLVEADKNIPSIFAAIRAHKLRIVTKPLNLKEAVEVGMMSMSQSLIKKYTGMKVISTSLLFQGVNSLTTILPK